MTRDAALEVLTARWGRVEALAEALRRSRRALTYPEALAVVDEAPEAAP